jgi:hypothetical protein
MSDQRPAKTGTFLTSLSRVGWATLKVWPAGSDPPGGSAVPAIVRHILARGARPMNGPAHGCGFRHLPVRRAGTRAFVASQSLLILLAAALFLVHHPALGAMSPAAMLDTRGLALAPVGTAVTLASAHGVSQNGPSVTARWTSTSDAFDCLARCAFSGGLPTTQVDSPAVPLASKGPCPTGPGADVLVPCPAATRPAGAGDCSAHPLDGATRRALLQVYRV